MLHNSKITKKPGKMNRVRKNSKGYRDPNSDYYLMAVLINKVWFRSSRCRSSYALVVFLPEFFDRACSKQILFSCSSDGNCALGASTFHVPHLSYRLRPRGHFLALTQQPLWIITRPHLHELNSVTIKKINCIKHRKRSSRHWCKTWIVWFLRWGWSKAGWWDMWTQSMISPSGLCFSHTTCQYLHTNYTHR